MGMELGVADALAAEPSAGRIRQRDHRFFTGMALAALVTILVGFGPTYYLGPLFAARPLTPLVHLHAVVFTLWCLLFLAQTSLIAIHRTDLHRRLGVAGGALAVIMLVVGYLTAVESARLGNGPPGRDPLAFLAVPLGALPVFGILVGTALWNRRRSETHKRLMLLATISLLMAAFARMRFIGTGGPPVAMSGTFLLVATCWIYDRLAHGRVHPAFLWGGLFVVVMMPVRFLIGTTGPWLAFARWVTGLAP
jgi:uncharacterized membrane protein YozB (DUF420 family)